MKKIYALAIIPLLAFSVQKASAQSKISEGSPKVEQTLVNEVRQSCGGFPVRIECYRNDGGSMYIIESPSSSGNILDQPIKLDPPGVFTYTAIQVECRGIDNILKDFPLLGKY